MKVFRMGLEGGKSEASKPGVQPEWFYKGDGRSLVAPGEVLLSPAFAMDGGEKPEVAGICVIVPDDTPCRGGFALANEFSDHVMEQMNHPYLAYSTLRPAVGSALLIGELPANIRGTAEVRGGSEIIWEKPFLTGEKNMSHGVRNLEHHHFKYELFRRPGDVQVHVFGTATLSFADGFKALPGEVFEIEAQEWGLPLRNPLGTRSEKPIAVRNL